MRVAVTLAVSTILFVAPIVRAQTVPHWSADLLVGSGAHTSLANGKYYDGSHIPEIRTALSLRLSDPRAAAVFFRGELSLGPAGDRTDVCYFAPDRSCLQKFEDGSGAGFAIGVEQILLPRIAVSVASGAGWYSDHRRTFTDASLSVGLFTHLAALANARYARWNCGDAHCWYAPITFGVQIH